MRPYIYLILLFLLSLGLFCLASCAGARGVVVPAGYRVSVRLAPGIDLEPLAGTCCLLVWDGRVAVFLLSSESELNVLRQQLLASGLMPQDVRVERLEQ
ncbi:MAG: hypothetical protein V4592_08295 [Bacteroidota bacterium]